jgi:hypothetical protein
MQNKIGPASHLFPVAQNPRFTRFLLSSILEPPKKILKTQKKITRASFYLLNLCAKFQDHVFTGSALNPPQKTLQVARLGMSSFI